MTVKTDVINEGLSWLGVDLIASPNEEREQARRANFLFNKLVRTELRRHAWNFALKRALLAEESYTPSWGFAHQFPLPSNFLRLWQVNDFYSEVILRDATGSDLSAYAIEGRKILTNFGSPLKIRYVSDMSEDIQSWDSMFRDIMALKLAIALEPALVKDSTLAQLLKKHYDDGLQDAYRVNAIELPPVPRADDSWVIGRY